MEGTLGTLPLARQIEEPTSCSRQECISNPEVNVRFVQTKLTKIIIAEAITLRLKLETAIVTRYTTLNAKYTTLCTYTIPSIQNLRHVGYNL